MQPWLNLSLFSQRISLPASLEMAVLEPFVTDAAENWLYNLIGKDKYNALNKFLLANPYGLAPDATQLPPVGDIYTFNNGLYPLVVAMLVYASWSGYILEGSIMATSTGMVEKHRADSDTITDTHRAELRRAYREKAEGWVLRITEYIRVNSPDNAAVPTRGSGTRIGKAAGKTQSKFPDYPVGFGPFLIIPDTNAH